MTRGSDQRIELELALFTLSEPPQAAAVPVAAMPVQTATPAAPVARPFVAAPIQPAPQPFMSTPAAPVEPMAAPAVENGACSRARCRAEGRCPGYSRVPRARRRRASASARRAAGYGVGPPCPGMSRLRRSLRLYRPYRKRDRWSSLPPEYTADPALSRPRKVAAEGVNPFEQWSEVVKLLQEKDPMLHSYLRKIEGIL